jgi:hypothetical protein
MPPPDRLATVYATDEEVLMTAGADFVAVCPRAFLFASGVDGAFSPSDPWTLASASVDFAAQGVAANMVLQLSGNRPDWKGLGGLLAVESVAGGACTLRRAGEAAGVGQPPGPPGGATGVPFLVTSLRAPIEDVAFELNEMFSIDPALVNRRPEDLYDRRIFRRLTVFRVLENQYANSNRSNDGDFVMKAEYYARRYREALSSATLRWGPTGTSQAATRLGSMRLTR